jgi:hypothetical protein
LVQQYIDWLDFQYRDQPPKKPFTLLAVSLTRGNLIRPEGFEDRKELKRRRLEKEQQQEATHQEEEKKRGEAEVNQEKLTQAQALFESLPEGEKEVWRQRAIRELPVFLRSMDSFVENQIHLLISEEKRSSSCERPVADSH